MFIAYIVVSILTALLATFSGVGKLQKMPRIVAAIHEVAQVPMSWFPFLAACEFAAAIGLIIGIFWSPLAVAAAIGLVIYFIGAIVAHVRVGDFKGVSSPIFPLALAVACLITRLLSF